MGKSFRSYSPDAAQSEPTQAGQIGPLDEVDRWALAVIDEWDQERKAARLVLVAPKYPADGPADAKPPQNAPGGQP